MRLELTQYNRVGSMPRKYTQGTDCVTDEDLKQIDIFAKKYAYDAGHCMVHLVGQHGAVVAWRIHKL